MASEADKKKAQALIDEVRHLKDEAKTQEEIRAWAVNALPKMDKAIELDPSNIRAWFSRGFIKNELGDHQGAFDDFTKVIELNQEDDGAWNNRGFAKSGLDDDEGAIDDFTKAIELNSTNPNTYHNRGLAKFRLKNYEDAIKDFDKALKLNPNNEAFQRSKKSAIVAEEEKQIRKEVEEYRERLEKKSKQFNSNYEQNIERREELFLAVLIIIALFIFILFVSGVFSGLIKNNEPFGLLPYLALLFAILSPLAWLIRINIREAERNLTLREDYDGRYTVELYLQRFFHDTERREFVQRYMTYWMYNNPSETLIRLANKSTEQPKLPQVEQMSNIAKSGQIPPTDQ